ncbi:MAG TPA: exodeoxyribonuclease VII large subunit, partial [Candidatus Limnocylindrales bacterium]
MGRSEPPDWALPAWDALTDEPLPARSAPLASSPAPASSPVPSQLPLETPLPGTTRPAIMGVTELSHVIRDAVRADDRLRDLWVEGEVGRVTVSSAGHAYFTLKDERSQLSCVWFRDDRISSPFEPRTGLRVVARGRIDVFEQQGVYQLYVSAVQPAGFGDLALRFEELKARLAAEGLFETGRKRPLPERPAVIAVATSSSGAVWHDIQRVLERRWPLARVVFASCQVQGDSAPASVVAA